MITRFWWVRHGPTHAKAAIGWTDLAADLSDTDALKRLSDFLPTDAHIVSSDLQRASATADAVQAARIRHPDRHGLREMNFGDWDGRSFTDIALSDPELSREFWEAPGRIAPPKGESWDDLAARIATTVDDLVSTHGSGDIIVVAHFAAILTALQRASGMTAKATFSFKIDNLSVTRLDFIHPSKSWRVHGVNHLP